MSEELKSDERIILMVDPFTKEHFVFNHTRYGVAEMDGEINAGKDADGNHVLSITATFVFRKRKKK